MDNASEKQNTGRCSICGGEQDDFGCKTLENGIICRDCASKLSEWLTDEELLHFDVLRIKRHLNYREKNKLKLASFIPSKNTEGKYKLYVDENSRSFVISKRKDYTKDNADVVRLSSVKKVKTETLPCENSEGVDVFVDIELHTKKLPRIRFRVNDFPGIAIDSEEYKKAKGSADSILKLLADSGINSKRMERNYEQR